MRPLWPQPKNDEERILPLVNVVFLLLVFFMLAGRLDVREPFEVALPRSISEAVPELQALRISIGADGRLGLDAEIVDESTLRVAVADRVSADPAIRVRLEADARVEATRVVALMELLREAGAARLMLLTVPRNG